MKYFTTLMVLLTLIPFSYSQSTIRVGAGYYMWGTGDLLVPTVELELRNDITSYLGYAISADFGHFSSLSNDEKLSHIGYTFTTFSSMQVLTFHLFRTHFIGLSLSGGSSIRYYHQLLLLPHRNEDPLSEEGSFRPSRYFIWGGHIRPEVHFQISKNNGLTLAASTSIYKNEIFSGFSLSFMHKLCAGR